MTVTISCGAASFAVGAGLVFVTLSNACTSGASDELYAFTSDAFGEGDAFASDAFGEGAATGHALKGFGDTRGDGEHRLAETRTVSRPATGIVLALLWLNQSLTSNFMQHH